MFILCTILSYFIPTCRLWAQRATSLYCHVSTSPNEVSLIDWLIDGLIDCNLVYAKPNVATFNIDIFIQFNPYSFNLIFIFIQFNLRSFNSIPIVILFNPHSFNSIFRSIQFNFCILLIQFQYWFNLMSLFIQFNFYIHSIQLLYSFNSVRLCSLNLYTHLFNLGVWVKGKFWAGSWDLYNKDGGGNAWGWRFPEVKSFFEHVISRTKEI